MRSNYSKARFSQILAVILWAGFFFAACGIYTNADANLFKALKLKGDAEKVLKTIAAKAELGHDILPEVRKMETFLELADQGKLDEARGLLDEIEGDLEKSKVAIYKQPEVTLRVEEIRKNPADRFAVWISDLKGSKPKLLISDPKRQMSHTRVSPDRKWILFTRYNKFLTDEPAHEIDGYQNTEVCIMGLNGQGLKVITGPKLGILNCNGSWLPDSRTVLFLSTENPQKKPLLYLVNIENGKVKKVPTPNHFSAVTDPHQIGNKMVFPAPGNASEPTALWMMNSDGTGLNQLTQPPAKMLAKEMGPHKLGDYDPRISPDGKKVLFMRNFGKDTYHIFVKALTTGEEKDLSRGIVIEGVGHWSSDGKLIIFHHVDPNNLKTHGLYTMKPDGSNRKKIPLPEGFLHCSQPNFFPGDGSSPEARIIYSTQRLP